MLADLGELLEQFGIYLVWFVLLTGSALFRWIKRVADAMSTEVQRKRARDRGEDLDQPLEEPDPQSAAGGLSDEEFEDGNETWRRLLRGEPVAEVAPPAAPVPAKEDPAPTVERGRPTRVTTPAGAAPKAEPARPRELGSPERPAREDFSTAGLGDLGGAFDSGPLRAALPSRAAPGARTGLGQSWDAGAFASDAGTTRPVLTRSELRRAVLWSEILAPPIALRRDRPLWLL